MLVVMSACLLTPPNISLLQALAWLWCPEQVLWWPASLWLQLLHVHKRILPAGSPGSAVRCAPFAPTCALGLLAWPRHLHAQGSK